MFNGKYIVYTSNVLLCDTLFLNLIFQKKGIILVPISHGDLIFGSFLVSKNYIKPRFNSNVFAL